jgi:antitoxin ParD1/3/4
MLERHSDATFAKEWYWGATTQGDGMPSRNVSLTQELDRFVAEQVSAGRFRNASEVLSAGLRLLEQQTQEEQEKLALLRSLASEGFGELDQGQGIEIPRLAEYYTRAWISKAICQMNISPATDGRFRYCRRRSESG